ncbi:unnamed protein product, partial [Didymodactylos carnosus]
EQIINSTTTIHDCPENEVSYDNHCYYLDGSGGKCSYGYSRASESILIQISKLFIGKNYKTAISDNCCIWTTDLYQNYYISAHCNKHGPFTKGPENLNGCINQTNQYPRQMTFCGSH